MADSFLNPADQARLDRLLSTLEGKLGELDAVIAGAREGAAELGTLTREEAAAQEARARELGKAGAPRAAPDSAAALRERIELQQQLNALIEREVAFRKEATAAIREAAGATKAETVAAELQMADLLTLLERLKAGGGLSFQTAGSAQRLINAIGAGEGTLGSAPAGGAPPIIPGGGAPGGGAPGGGGKGLSDEQQRLVDSAMNATDEEAKLGAQLQKNVLLMSQASDEYSRHGALTTEFIQAAARGQVTLREFGSQVTQTIGKFAGWTAAATAVYGAVGAIGKLAEGAVHAQSAVQGLTRFIPNLNRGLATTQIASIAQDLIVPVQDVGEASGAFARIFKNQGDVMTASRVAITATKLDNIKLADSYRYLTALTQEYGLTAAQLPGLFDQIEAAQAKGGARVSELFPALARSAAAVKAAGGDLNQLLALEATAIVRTGQTGNVVGTAFSRGAANFFRSQSSQDTFQRYGIAATPDVGFTQALVNAMKVASTKKLTGSQALEISKAFFGPLRGALLPGVFRSEDLYRHFAGVTAPGAARGQAQKELDALRKQADQQVKAIGVNLQAIGAQLTQSGLLGPLGGFVKLLNTALTTTTKLLEAWNQLPGPVKSVAGYAAALYGARAVTQRTGLTGVPFFGRGQAQVDRSALTRGLQDEEQYYQTRYQATGRQAADATLVADAARRTRDSAKEAVQEAELAGDEEVILAAQQRLAAAQRAFLRTLDREVELEAERDVLAQRAVTVQTALTSVERDLNRGLTAQEAAAGAGIHYRSATLAKGRVTGEGAVIPVSDIAKEAESNLGAAATTAAAGTAAAGVVTAQETTRLGILGRAKAAYARQIAAEAGAASAVASASAASVAGTAAATEQATTVGGALATVGSGVGRLVPALFAIGLVAGGITDSMDQVDAAAKNVDAQLKQVPKSIDQARAQADQVDADAKTIYKKTAGGGAVGSFISGIPIIGQAALSFSEWLGKQISGHDYRTQTSQGQTAAILEGLTAPVTTRTVQRPTGGTRQGGLGLPTYAPQKTTTGGLYTVLLDYAQRDSQDVGNTLQGRQRWERERQSLYNRARSASTKLEQGLDKQGVALVENAFKGFAGSLSEIDQKFQAGLQLLTASTPKGMIAQLRAMKLDTIVSDMQVLGQRMQVFGANQGDLQKMAQSFAFLAYRLRNSRDPKNIQLLLSARSAFEDAIRHNVQGLIDTANAATSKSAKRADLAAARAALRSGLGLLNGAFQQLKAQIIVAGITFEESEAALKMIEAAAKAASSEVIPALTKLPAFAGGKPKGSAYNYSQVIAGIKAAQKKSLKDIQGILPAISGVGTDLDPLKQSLKQASDKAAGAGGDPLEIPRLREQIKEAQLAQNPVAVAESALAFANFERRHAHGLRAQLNAELDIATATNQLREARQAAADEAKQKADQAAQDAVEIARLRNQLQQANAANNPVQQAQYARQFAGWEIARARNEKERLQGLIDMANADKQLADSLEEKRQAMFELAASETTDPVKQAKIAVDEANQKVKYEAAHGGKDTTAYINAVTDRNQKRQSYRDALEQSREDDIQFNLDLGKISVQAAIDQYQSLLKMHNLTKATRRRILEQIHQLQTQGSSEFGALNLGSIRLPTPYEIRAGLLAAQRGRNEVAPQTNHFNVTVNSEAGAAAFWTGADRHINGAGKSVQRAQGVR